MNNFWQIIWMMIKVSLFGLGVLLMFGGGVCGVFFLALAPSGGGAGYGVLLLAVAAVAGVLTVKIAKSFRNKAPQPPADQPPPDDGSGWDK